LHSQTFLCQKRETREVKDVKKTIVFLLIIGVLLIGTLPIMQNIYDSLRLNNITSRNSALGDISFSGDFFASLGDNPSPNGGGGGGGGSVPG
jgi:hypothetical protein